MEYLKAFAGIVFLLCICKLVYELAMRIGNKAKFYERFSQVMAKYRGRRSN